MPFPVYFRRLFLHGLLSLMAMAILMPSAVRAATTSITVYAASSLTNVLQAVATAYTQDTGNSVKFSFAASSALARQIEAGARADMFISADSEWMDYVQSRALITTATRRNLLSNRLVLVTQADNPLQLKITPGFALASALGARGRLAVGDPDYVPAGRYARSALTSLAVWNDVADRLVRCENVRAALAFVARKETPLGIVYETDARVEPKVRIVDIFPANTHQHIIYPIALTQSPKPEAQLFLDYLRRPKAQEIFRAAGFIPL